MSPSPVPFALLVSIGLVAACASIEDEGLVSGVPSVQPAGTGAPPEPTAPVRPDGYALSGGAVTPGRWTSLACTYDADTVALWVDGRKAAENMRTGPIRTGSPTGLAVGNELPEENPFDGLIDNVRVWREVRSARQICAGARGCMPTP